MKTTPARLVNQPRASVLAPLTHITPQPPTTLTERSYRQLVTRFGVHTERATHLLRPSLFPLPQP